jgi:hypothetical protein
MTGNGRIFVLHLLSIHEGAGEGEFVGVFDVAAGGESAGEAGDSEAEVFEFLFEVEGGEVAFGGRVGGEDDLGDFFVRDTLEEFGDVEVSAVLGALHDAAKHVIATAIAPESFEGDDVEGFLHHTEGVRVAAFIGADVTEGIFGNMKAALARVEAMEIFECLGEGFELVLILLEEIEHESFGESRSDRWQGNELFDQFLEGFGVHAIRGVRSKKTGVRSKKYEKFEFEFPPRLCEGGD